ncbi:MAG: histidine ammonia-lyase [Mariniblastus sp.]|nr:histidine ammonia-lyase [Mariniblastus sp.]
MMITPGQLTHDQIRQFYRSSIPVKLDDSCWSQVENSHSVVLNLMQQGETIYGINTGFGLLANKQIPESDLEQLQLNIVRSHSAGVGELLDDSVVRLVMLLKLASLARGFSGVRPIVIQTLMACLNQGIIPCIPSKGSVGASGDLAPLAHMSLALIGEGEVRNNGETMPAAEALAQNQIKPLKLGPKEGLALLNGTQVSTALALVGLYDAQQCFDAAIVAGAMSIDAAMGSDTPFDERIHQVRNHPTQIECARRYRHLLDGSEIRNSHRDCKRVQDPYSLRCQPQVMGACLELLNHASQVLIREANSVSDNPLVFENDQSILSGGNFHAEPVAMAADEIAIAVAEIGSLSERRIALLIDQHLSELPPFLVNDGGLNSGFMIPQVTAAALTSENKHLASPASVDSLPTSANQEDHVSMATYAARRLQNMNDNAATIVAIEFLASAQGLDFRLPLKTSPRLKVVLDRIRVLVPFYEQDRTFSSHIESVKMNIVCTPLDAA